MDPTRGKNTCRSHVGGLSRRYHAMLTTTWAPDLELDGHHPHMGSVTDPYLPPQFTEVWQWQVWFGSPISSINTCDSSSFGTHSLLDIRDSQSVTLSWLDRRSACRYPPHRQASGRRRQTTAPEARLEVISAMQQSKTDHWRRLWGQDKLFFSDHNPSHISSFFLVFLVICRKKTVGVKNSTFFLLTRSHLSVIKVNSGQLIGGKGISNRLIGEIWLSTD